MTDELPPTKAKEKPVKERLGGREVIDRDHELF
jgi:hypothetical protein